MILHAYEPFLWEDSTVFMHCNVMHVVMHVLCALLLYCEYFTRCKNILSCIEQCNNEHTKCSSCKKVRFCFLKTWMHDKLFSVHGLELVIDKLILQAVRQV